MGSQRLGFYTRRYSYSAGCEQQIVRVFCFILPLALVVSVISMRKLDDLVMVLFVRSQLEYYQYDLHNI